MCVIIYKQANIKIDVNTLLLARNTNPDGLGVAYFDENDGVIFERNLKPTKKDLCDLIQKTKNKVAIFHFRIATSGGVNLENCQPIYNEKGNFLLFHNGIIHSLNGISKTESDTVLLSYLLEKEGINKHQILEKLSDRTCSKFALIDESNQVFLFGDFKEYHGLKCSNLNFVPCPVVPLSSRLLSPTMEEAQKKEIIYKNYDDFFASRRCKWEDDLLINDDL